MSLVRRKRKPGIFRTPKFFAAFQRNTEATLFRNNKVELLPDGGFFFPALVEAVRQAKHLVLVEFYIIRDDHAGREFADALIAAAENGARVFVIYDYIGCFDTSGGYFRRLEKRGVTCLAFNPPPFRRGIAWFDKRNHRKLAVIDGRCAFIGGLNIGNEYAGFGDHPRRWRDVGMKIEGPAVSELARLFWDSWESEGKNLPDAARAQVASGAADGDADLIIISGGPHHNRSYIRSTYRMAIAGASDTITILTPYFVPGPRIIRSLLRASLRGVHVRIILPSISDVRVIRWASRAFFTPLLKAGIEVYEREGTVLHAKVMLIDRSWAVFGSANLDHRSFHRNYELNVIVDSHDFGMQVDDMIVARDLARSRRITLEEHEARGVLGKVLEALCSPISRFL